MRLLYIFIFLLNNQSLDSIFDSSNDFYTNGNYQMAIEGYKSILNSGFESAELYYNLGNAFYKLNNIPESNFFYEKARSILPDDEDVLINLSFAQNLRIDKIEKLPISQTQNLKINILKMFSEKGWSILLITLAWATCISLILYLSINKSIQKRIFFSQSIILLIIAIVILIINIEKKELNNEKFAIVFDKEVEVWSEPNRISELKFLLHEGTKVKQIDTIQDWVNIQLENGTLGWIQSSTIKILD
mgnify:FL=1|tara:strand:+ start:497 stop:1234 length:738 start_codon:yes stop_codon:yes gene_type:complete